MAKKNYSEKEVAQIFKRAAELESKHSENNQPVDGGTGLSLDELSQIAVDAGLDPENVRRAAGELSPSESDEVQTSRVQKNEVIAERWVKGHFTDEAADLIIADLNHRYNATHEKVSWMDNIMHDASIDSNQKSQVKRTGKSLEWSKINEYNTERVRALIQPRADQVRIRVIKENIYGQSFENSNGLYGFISFIPYLAGIILLFALPNSLLINAGFAILATVGLHFLVSKNSDRINKTLSDSKQNKLDSYRKEVESIANDIAELIGKPEPNEKTTTSTQKKDKINIPDDTISESEYDKSSSQNRNRAR